MVHDETRRARFKALDEAMAHLLALAAPNLSEFDRRWAMEYFDHGEYALAWETLAKGVTSPPPDLAAAIAEVEHRIWPSGHPNTWPA